MATTRRAGQRRKRIEEVVGYALNHRTRVHILIILNEGTFTAKQIADIIGEPLNNVSNHIRELLDAGSIELAKTEMVRNTQQHHYRAVEIPHYSDEEVAAMTPRRSGNLWLGIQSMIAEIMAALWAGQMEADPRVWLAWDWRNVDLKAARKSPRSRNALGSGFKKLRSRPRTAGPRAVRSHLHPRLPDGL